MGAAMATAAPAPPPTGDALAERLAADLDGAFEELVVTHQDRLYAFALRLTGSPPDAEEVAQDAFVRAHRALAGYPAERVRALAMRPWLFRIALNVVRNRVRGKRLRLVPLDALTEGGREPAAAARDRPEEAVGRAEGDAALAALVTALPPRYRAAVVLRYVADLGYEEIATALGQPVGTAKSNVHRGVRLLRERLASPREEA